MTLVRWCLGFGGPMHKDTAIVTLRIAPGTRFSIEIPLCAACTTHPRIDAILRDPHASLS